MSRKNPSEPKSVIPRDPVTNDPPGVWGPEAKVEDIEVLNDDWAEHAERLGNFLGRIGEECLANDLLAVVPSKRWAQDDQGRRRWNLSVIQEVDRLRRVLPVLYQIGRTQIPEISSQQRLQLRSYLASAIKSANAREKELKVEHAARIKAEKLAFKWISENEVKQRDEDLERVGRLTFDNQAFVVSVDGKDFQIEDPKAYSFYKWMAQQPAGKHVTKREIGATGGIAGMKGEKALKQTKERLPEELRHHICSDNQGVYYRLPPLKKS